MVVSLSKRLLTMLDDEYMTDVVFDVQGQQFKCHKLILSSCETRLKQLVADSPQVKVDDVAPHTFQAIIKLLYSSEDCMVTDSNVFELMHAAKIFEIGDLERSCSEFIRNKKLSERNVCVFTSQALHFDAKDSLKACLDFFKQNTLKVLNTEQFLDIPREVLQVFLENKSDDCSDSRFFTACFNWAKAHCKRKKLEEKHENFREVLGDELINGIKYEKMEMSEFLRIVVFSKVLTQEEIGRHIQILENKIKVTVKDHEGNLTTIDSERDAKIKDIKRKRIWNEGRQIYGANLFTLSHNGKTLNDEMILRGVDPLGESLCLEVDTFTITLYDCESKAQEPFLLQAKDLQDPRSAIEKALCDNNYGAPSIGASAIEIFSFVTQSVLLGNSDNFGRDEESFYWSENDPPQSFQPGSIIYHRQYYSK